MGHIHDVGDNYFGLEERQESFVITFGGDREEHGVFVYADKGISGDIELTFERVADLKRLLDHSSVIKNTAENDTKKD